MMNEIAVYSLRLVKEHEQKYANTKITSPIQLARLVNEMFDLSNRPNEMMVMVCLNTKFGVIGGHVVSTGTLTASLASPRDIYKAALLNNATAIMLAHNHPSGDPTPSDSDLQVTQMLVEAGELIDVKLIDHVVMGNKDEYGVIEHVSMIGQIDEWAGQIQKSKKW